MSLQRLRYNFLTGTIQSIDANNKITFTNSTGLGNITITSGTNYLPLIINPAPYGSTVNSEIVWLNGYSANSNTGYVYRAQENSPNGGTWPANTVFAHGPTSQDYNIVNMIANVDLPTPLADGNFLVASGVAGVRWSTYVSGTNISGSLSGPGVTISGFQITSWIPAAQVSGILGTTYGVQVNATSLSGNANTNFQVPGSQVFGALSASGITGALNQATISGSSINGPIPATQVSGIMGTVTISGNTLNSPITNPAVTIPNAALAFTVNSQISSYTPILSDASSFILMSGVSSAYLYLPSGIFGISAQINVIRRGTGPVLFSGTTNTSVFSTGTVTGGPALRNQYSVATAICLSVAPCQWLVTGDIV